MLMPSTSMKVTESGQYAHAPPKKSGWKIWSAAVSHPLLDLRDQFLHDRVAIGAVVHRVDGIRVVEIRRRMLEGHGDHPREAVAEPCLREVVLLVEAVRRGEREVTLD